jgi:tol-pal system protein YbgF
MHGKPFGGGAAPRRALPPKPRAGRILRLAPAMGPVVLSVVAVLPGCVAPGLMARQGSLDSLRAVVDTLVVRDSIAYTVLADTRREVAEQRDILLSTRATSGNTTQELFQQMERLEVKLDEVMGRFQRVSDRGGFRPPGGANPGQLYDQAAEDLTQGRYEMALQGFQTFLREHPVGDLADNALYGVGESYFALAQFDSASAAYAGVEERYPMADKVPAALFKLALSQEKEGRAGESKKTLEDLVRRFPNSGEAQLARERLGSTRRR